MDIDREVILQHDQMLLPVNLIADINPVQIAIDTDILNNCGFQILPLNPHCRPDRSCLHNPKTLQLIDLPRLFRIVVVDIPGVIIMRPVLIADDDVPRLSILQDLALRPLVIEMRKLSLIIELDSEEIVLHAG